jgi:Lipocalin-like domain
MTFIRTLGISVVVVAASLSLSAQAPSLKGAWRVVEVTAPDGKVDSKPEPGLYIFTDRHYSIMRVNQPRTALPEAPTDKDRLAAFDPFTANSGTYQIKGTQLMTQPMVAKNPNVMMGKGGTTELKMEGANVVYISGGGGSQGKQIVKLQRVE